MSLRSFLTNWAIGSTAIVVIAALAPMVADADAGPGAAGATPVPGMAGTDTALPLTDSAVTVDGRGKFADLTITVNQTKNLADQAISITWTGGAPTVRGQGTFDSNFLQFMQCWGDDDETNSDNPGPAPEQCEYGAIGGSINGAPRSSYPNGYASTRTIGNTNWPAAEGSTGTIDDSGRLVRPFRPVNGPEVVSQVNLTYDVNNPSTYWLNPYYDRTTTNEVPASKTYSDGTGQELFEVLTGVQSTGLGCGQRVQIVDATTKKTPRCWLVIVPRGLAEDENVGTPFEGFNASESGVYTSPLSDAAWANRISIELQFDPVESPCSIDADDRRMVGTDLALPAVASWQPVICTTDDLPPFSFAPLGDPLARRQITNPVPGGPGMIVVSQPVTPGLMPADEPLVYAPLTVSGLVIGFNVERIPDFSATGEVPLSGSRIASISLTPRLVAKLLTQSYGSQLDMVGNPPAYAWLATNPYDLALDPDFLRFNPEFKLLRITERRTFGGLQIPLGNMDAATALWAYILADPEAKEWMTGQPDEWGMTINPYYSSDPAVNLTGVSFGDPLPVNFPKSDPYCYQAGRRLNGTTPTPLCGTDWMPYSRSMGDSARIARTARDGARIEVNDFGLSPSLAWSTIAPQNFGERAMLVVTDSPSAARYGVQTARLSRPGDNGEGREFVAADSAGLEAGLKAMKPKAEPQVLEPDPSNQPVGAYPLTVMAYGVAAPLSLDDDARSDFASFVRYAAGPGQVEGFALGQLPVGYVPLTGELKQQALDAADKIESLEPTPSTTTTTTTTTSVSPTPTTEPQPPHDQPTPVYAPSRNSSGGGSQRSGGSTDSGSTITPTPSAPPTTASSSAPSTAPSTTDALAASSSLPPALGDEPITPQSPASILTPVLALGQNRMAVPALGSITLAAGLGALEITKRPRRVRGGAPGGRP